MKIGILSDTHGNISATAKAAAAFREAGVDAVFHCGDIGGMDVLAELAGVFEPQGISVHAVFGNIDIHASDWKFFPSNIGVTLHGRFGDVAFGGKRIALLHGDDARRFRKVVAGGEYDLVLTGHSHEVHDFVQGRTRCLNPGTAGRGTPNTGAVLDLESGAFQVVSI